MTSNTHQPDSQGLEPSPLDLGCMGMSELQGGRGEAAAIAPLRRAIGPGVTPLDTAGERHATLRLQALNR